MRLVIEHLKEEIERVNDILLIGDMVLDERSYYQSYKRQLEKAIDGLEGLVLLSDALREDD